MGRKSKVKEGILALCMVISGFVSLGFMLIQESMYSLYATIIGLITLTGYVSYIYHVKKDEILRSGWS